MWCHTKNNNLSVSNTQRGIFLRAVTGHTGNKVCNHFLSHLLATGFYDFLTVWGSQGQLTGTSLYAYC